MSSVSVQIDHESGIPVKTQIASAYALAIREGILAPGTRLPSIRALAQRLRVSPATIVAAYRELSDGGIAAASPRSAFCVAGSRSLVPPFRSILPLSKLEPDLRVHPVGEFLKLLSDISVDDPSIAGYENYRGYLPLREALSDMDRSCGIDTDPESGMLITSGTQQALTLIARCFGQGSRIAFENPCYGGSRVAFSNAGAKVVPVSSGPDGPDPAALAKISEPGSVAAFYCCPTYGNPHGYTWPPEARLRVLEAAKKGGFMVIEDDYLGDLDYLGEKPARLASLAVRFPGVSVTRLHTFSKCLFPALRIAAVTGSAGLLDRMLKLKISDDICSSAFLQRGLAAFIAGGRYEAHLERVRPVYRERREILRSALGGIGGGFAFGDPLSGLCLLGRIPESVSLPRFIAECAKDGVILMPGSDYWAGGTGGETAVRLGFAPLSGDEIARAAGIIKSALHRSREPSVDHSFV